MAEPSATKEAAKTGAAEMVKVTIDGRETEVEVGTTILQAARELGIHIPTLCYHDDLSVSGSCRICVVEVEGFSTLQIACAFPIERPINVTTSSPRIRRSRRHTLDLLLGHHWGDCYTCKRNGSCELQELAADYGIDTFNYPRPDFGPFELQADGPIVRDMNKCIGCFRCVRTCGELQDIGALVKVDRGELVHIESYAEKPLIDTLCVACGQCINRCPTGALTEKDYTDDVWAAIDDPTKHVVIQTAPAPRAAMGEAFDLGPGVSVTKRLNTALKRCGFDKVFDTNMTADLTIMEEGTELLLRLKKALVDKEEVALPQFTSCSPGWIKFVEHNAPDKLAHISSCKSPQQMFGAIIKTYYAEQAGIDPKDIVSVSLMPCTAKKYESQRPEMTDSGFQDVDYALTTRELAKMIKEAGIDLPNVPKSDFDDPVGLGSGAGIIFGATGGVMEAAIRTAYEIVTGNEVPFDELDITPVRGMEGIRSAELPVEGAKGDWAFLEGATLKVLVAHGTANARKVIEMLDRGELDGYHFVEIMACPGGCLGGGGQPIPTSPAIREKRAQTIYAEDHVMEYRKSHDNPVVQKLYKEYFTDGPCGHKSHKYLHTHYVPRGTRMS